MMKSKEKYFFKEYDGGTRVVWGKAVNRQLAKTPEHIREKFQAWVTLAGLVGIRAIRRRSGFHDEPLKGPRQGQRSVRLSHRYRAIDVEHGGTIYCLEVVEVNKHDY